MRRIYSRVSTVTQNGEQQTKELLRHLKIKAADAVIYEDKVSGKNLDRPQLDKLLNDMSEGETVYCYDVSRLGRNTQDVLELVSKFKAGGVKLVIQTLSGIDITSTHGEMILTVLASVATMQRNELLEKQAIGIERAKEEGKYQGRKANADTVIKCQKVFDTVSNKVLKLPEALKAFDTSRATYYRWKANQV